MQRVGFTMIEVIFVIVVLGILASVAIPRFAATRVDAQISKGRADVASIRSAIVSERQSRLIRGCARFIPNGTSDSDALTCPTIGNIRQMDNGGLFGGVLMYPIQNQPGKDGGWSATNVGSGTYIYRAGGKNTTFNYYDNNGTFVCDPSANNYCDKLIN